MNNISVKYNWSQILAQYALQLTNTGIILYKNISNSNLIDMRGIGRAQIIYDPTDDKVKISENNGAFTPIIQTIPPIPPFYNFLSGLNMNVLTSGSNVTYSTISNPTFTEATVNGNINVTGLVDGYDISTMGATVSTLSGYLNQDVKTTSSPIFSNATIGGYDMNIISATAITVDGEVGVLNSRVNQAVNTTSSPTFAGATINGNMSIIGLVDGYDISTMGATVSTLSGYLNQPVLTTSSPTFNELTLTSSTPLKLFVAGSSNKVATVSALHWDPTNSRLGINTSTPSTTLHVNSTVSTPNLMLSNTLNTDNRIFAYLTNSGTADPLFRMVAARGLVSNAVNDVTAQLGLDYSGTIGSALRFHRGGSGTDSFASITTNTIERMRIDNTGNVGIGTNTPSYKLDVTGSGRFTNEIDADGGVNTSTIRNDNGTLTLSSANNDLIFATNGSERFRVSSAGNILTSGGVLTFSNQNTGNNNTNFTFKNGTTGSYSITLSPWSDGNIMTFDGNGSNRIRSYINGTANTEFISLTSSGGALYNYMRIGSNNLNNTGAMRMNNNIMQWYTGTGWRCYQPLCCKFTISTSPTTITETSYTPDSSYISTAVTSGGISITITTNYDYAENELSYCIERINTGLPISFRLRFFKTASSTYTIQPTNDYNEYIDGFNSLPSGIFIRLTVRAG